MCIVVAATRCQPRAKILRKIKDFWETAMSRARHELMPAGQYLARDQRGIFESAEPEHDDAGISALARWRLCHNAELSSRRRRSALNWESPTNAMTSDGHFQKAKHCIELSFLIGKAIRSIALVSSGVARSILPDPRLTFGTGWKRRASLARSARHERATAPRTRFQKIQGHPAHAGCVEPDTGSTIR